MNSVIESLLASGEFVHRGQSYPIAHCTAADICRRYANLILDNGATRALEIGTLFGFSSLFLAEALRQNGGQLDTIDIRYRSRTWVDGREIEDIHEVAEQLIEQADLRDTVTFMVGDSNQVLADLITKGRQFDFALIDGSHRFEVALLDFLGVDRMLKVGGYVAMDDIGATVSSKDGLAGGPNRVLEAVFATARYEIELISANVAVCKKMKNV